MKTLKEALIGKNNIDNADIDVFNKKSLKIGTIVMFRDKTFGVYVEGDIAQRLKKKFVFDNASDKYFFSHGENDYVPCYLDLSQLNNDLYHRGYRSNSNLDVIKIYDKRIKEDELEKIVSNFYYEINQVTSTMKYKERK